MFKKKLVASETKNTDEEKDGSILLSESKGEIRQAFGTMKDEVIADKIKGNDTRRKNDDLFTYWDCEKEAFRSFKKFNLVKIA